MAGLLDPQPQPDGLLGDIRQYTGAPSRAIGGLLDYAYNYSPHTRQAVDSLGTMARGLLEYASPAGDMTGMRETSGATMDALRNRDWSGGLANAGMTAAAIPMMFMPGTVKGVGDAADAVTDAARRLPMDEASRMARADKMFPVDAYHGTTSPDIESFRQTLRPKEQLGFGTHVTVDPAFANEYAIGGSARTGTSPNIMPLRVNPGKVLDATAIVEQGTPEFALAKKLAGPRLLTQKNENGVPVAYLQAAIDATNPKRAQQLIRDAGYDSVKYEARIVGGVAPSGHYSKGPAAESYTILDPKNIRSRFAAFDPAKAGSADLLAGILPFAVGAGLLASPEDALAAP
jgi:hypothetical protein